MTANYPVDLHSHTYLSDGADSLVELVENAVARGLKVLALTDHDVLPPAEVHLAGGGSHCLEQWAKGRGLCLLRGIEFSCEKELEDVHIVGLGCDWTNGDLQKEAGSIARGKAVSYEETIRRLNERGYTCTMEELLSLGGSRVDILSLQKKRIFDLIASKGYVESWADAKLMVRDDAYLNVKRDKPAGLHVIDIIHRAGGIAILAHPYLIDPEVTLGGKAMSRWDYIETLIAGGLDGIETRYTYSKTTCKDKRPSAEIWAEVAAKADGRLLVSAGSDYHADHKKKAAHPRELGECGLTMEEFLSAPAFAGLYRQIMGEGEGC